MLKKILVFIFFIVCLMGPQKIKFHIPFASYLSLDHVFLELKDKSFMTYKNNQLLSFSNQKITSVPVENYVDFSPNGYAVLYDKMGNDINLYEKENLIHTWKNQYKYPRLHYPFIFFFSSDMSKAEVYSVLENRDKPLCTVVSSEMFTSWASAPNGEYFILGDLSGKAFIYNAHSKKVHTFSSEKSKNNYIKGVHINSSGDFCVLSGLSPELLYMGNARNQKQAIFSIPPTGRTRRLIYNFSQYMVIEKDYGVFIVNKDNKTIKEHNLNFNLYDGKEINYKGENFLVLLMREGNTNRVEIFSENNYQYSLWIHSESIPRIEHRHKKVLIIWENGAIEI